MNDTLHKAIITALETEVRRIVDEEASAAAKRVEDRVRGMAGYIATKVCERVRYEAFRNEIVITVIIDNNPIKRP